ncbi:VWA domain-containing protein [Litorivivens sp.]|uniref:VWA domain-containing protein n=1 Tax=Litorivivens sp. TaxID=2020868 RepID=UPI003561B65F
MTESFPEKRSSSQAIASFLDKAEKLPAKRDVSGCRLVFALDATASRQPTWDQARALHGEMFDASKTLGGLSIQLCYYRGLGQFHASPWGRSPGQLHDEMVSVRCAAGYTQIHTLLRHCLAEHQQEKLKAVIFIGDAVEESVDALCGLAGECGLRQLPLFLFQEGSDGDVTRVFKRLAKLSGGAYARFDAASAAQLRDLLRAVASYASGGVDALRKLQDNAARHLLEQL